MDGSTYLSSRLAYSLLCKNSGKYKQMHQYLYKICNSVKRVMYSNLYHVTLPFYFNRLCFKLFFYNLGYITCLMELQILDRC